MILYCVFRVVMISYLVIFQRRLRSLEREVDTTPMSVLTQNLIEEKNQEIDHLNQQLDRIRFEMAALKSGEALRELVQREREREREREMKKLNVFRFLEVE